MNLLGDVARGIFIFFLCTVTDVYRAFYLLKPSAVLSFLAGVLFAPLTLIILMSGRPLQDLAIQNMLDSSVTPPWIARSLRRLREPQ